MNRRRTITPVYLRLALRDLSQNKLATVVLVVVLSLVIAVSSGAILVERLKPYDSRIEASLRNATLFNNSDSPFPLQATAPSYVPLEDILGDEELTILTPQNTDNASLDGIPDPWDEGLIEFEPSAPPIAEPNLSIGPWSQPEWTAQLHGLEGRVPSQPGEIAFARSWLQPSEAPPTTAAQQITLGSTVTATLNEMKLEFTVVGLFDDSPLVYAAAAVLPDGEFSLWDEDSYAVGPRLSDETALALASRLHLYAADYWDAWNIRNLSEDRALATRAALTIPPSDFEQYHRRGDSFTGLILFGVLSTITLLSIPLYWQNTRRRALQFTQLDRNGMSPTQRLMSRLLPAVLTGLTATAVGVGLMLCLLPQVTRFWGMDGRVPISTGNALEITVLIALCSGLLPPIIASLVPVIALTSRASDTEVHGSELGDAGEVTPPTGQPGRTSLRGALLVIGAGLTTIVVSASFIEQGQATPWMLCGLAVVITGTYFLLARIFMQLSVSCAQAQFPIRLAAHELAVQRVFSVNATIPIVLLAAVGTAYTVIGRQHDIEDYLQERTYLTATLWIAVVIAVLIVSLTFFACIRNVDELDRWRGALVVQGVTSDGHRQVDGFRALMIVGVGVLVGYVLGTVIGAALMLYRAGGFGGDMGFRPVSMLPDATTLIVIVVPFLLAYPTGWVAGRRNARLVAVPT